MTAAERDLYKAVEDYIATTYNQASAAERSAVGFVMTIYRRRLASSFRALRTTLEKHLNAIESGNRAPLVGLDEDAPDDETADEIPDAEEIAEIERRALAAEERADIERLLARIVACPSDSKLAALEATLATLRGGWLRADNGVHPVCRHHGFPPRRAPQERRATIDVLLRARRRNPGRGRHLARNRPGRREAPFSAWRG